MDSDGGAAPTEERHGQNLTTPVTREIDSVCSGATTRRRANEGSSEGSLPDSASATIQNLSDGQPLHHKKRLRSAESPKLPSSPESVPSGSTSDAAKILKLSEVNASPTTENAECDKSKEVPTKVASPTFKTRGVKRRRFRTTR